MRTRIKDALARTGFRLERMSSEERRLYRGYEPRHAPTAEDRAYLSSENPRLRELEATYAADDSPVGAKSLWTDATVADDVDLRFFRGDNLYLWQYTRSPLVNRFRHFIYARYIQSVDHRRLLGRLTEDGAFGCLTFDYPGMSPVSRDLLDSIGELTFLATHADLFDRTGLRVLDIGAGYGRLAHRMLEAAPNVEHYWCVDAVPRSSFLCEYYLGYRGLSARSTVVELPDVSTAFEPGQIDIAVNIHSFSEMPQEAVKSWIQWLAVLGVDTLLIVPNEQTRVLSRETDGSRLDCAPILTDNGYELAVAEETITDQAVRDLLEVHDCFLLYRHVGGA